MEDGRHDGPERRSVFGFEPLGRRCEADALAQMGLLAVLDSTLRQTQVVVAGAHPELADWPAGDEQWLHDDKVVYGAFSLVTMAGSLRHVIACYQHWLATAKRPRDETPTTVARVEPHPRSRRMQDPSGSDAVCAPTSVRRRG